MSGQALLVWMVVGVVAGCTRFMVLGKGYGLLGDLIVGIAGAYVGGELVRVFGLRVPFHGLAVQDYGRFWRRAGPAVGAACRPPDPELAPDQSALTGGASPGIFGSKP